MAATPSRAQIGLTVLPDRGGVRAGIGGRDEIPQCARSSRSASPSSTAGRTTTTPPPSDLPEKLQRDPARHARRCARRGRSTAGFTKCASARRAAGPLDRDKARAFFEDNFKPVRILPEVHSYGYYTGADGFYTGYYEAEVTGSRVKTADYKVPLYRVPAKTCRQEEHGVLAIRSHRHRGRRARRQGSGDLLDQEPGRRLLRADPGLDPRQARRRRVAAAQLHRQQRQALHAGRPPHDRRGPLHARRHVDGQDPRIHGSQSGRGQSAAREEPFLRVLLRDAAQARRRAARRAGHPADAGAFARGRSHVHVYGKPIWIDAKFPITSDQPKDTFRI